MTRPIRVGHLMRVFGPAEAAGAAAAALLLEDGFFVLLESGDHILLE